MACEFNLNKAVIFQRIWRVLGVTEMFCILWWLLYGIYTDQNASKCALKWAHIMEYKLFLNEVVLKRKVKRWEKDIRVKTDIKKAEWL